MSRIIEQQRIDTAFQKENELEQKQALDDIIVDMTTRIGELASKSADTLTESQREEVIRARDFIRRLDAISTEHRYRDHFIRYSQETRNILNNQLKEVRAVHAEAQSQRAELSSEKVTEA